VFAGLLLFRQNRFDYLEERVEMIIQKGSRSLPDILSVLKEKLAAIKETVPR